MTEELNQTNFDLLSDPAEQLKSIRYLREQATQRLSQLDNSIQRFIYRFDQQKGALTELYTKTQQHQILIANATATRDLLQQTLDLLSTSQKLTPIIETNVATNFEEYVQTMGEIKQALQSLSTLNFEDGKIEKENLQNLQDKGREKLTDYFTILITKYQTPFPLSYWSINDQGDFVIQCEGLNNNLTYPITDADFEQLQRIAQVLIDIDDTHVFERYYESRQEFIAATMKKISKNTKPPVFLNGPIDPLLIPTYFRKSAMIHLLLFTYRFIVERETEIARRIFGDRKEVFDNVIQPSFKEIFMSSIKAAYSQTPSQHVDCLFELDVIQTIQTILPSFDANYTDEASKKHQRDLSNMINPFANNIKNIIDSLEVAIEKHDQAFLTSDGGVSPLTSNVLLFLIHLFPYQGSFQLITPLDSFVTKMITSLRNNINTKSNHYSDRVLAQLFLMNNLQFIVTTVKSTKLKGVFPPDNQLAIEDQIQKSQEEYIKLTWDTAFVKLDIPDIGEIKEGGLNKKQKQIIKAAFKNFIDRVNEIQAKHRKYNTKNTKLMQPILNDTLQKITHKYDKFYVKWKDSGFSKNPTTYISYQPATLAQLVTMIYTNPKANTSE